MPLIEKSSYDFGACLLPVWLVTNGKRYQYRTAPPESYGAYRAALSKGHFFYRRIRPDFGPREGSDSFALNTPTGT